MVNIKIMVSLSEEWRLLRPVSYEVKSIGLVSCGLLLFLLDVASVLVVVIVNKMFMSE